MRYRIEVPLQVCVIHLRAPRLDVLSHRRQRLVRRSPWSESVGTVLEVRLEDQLQDQQHRCLHHPVPDARNPQRALAPIRFGDVHPSYCLWPVGLRAQLLVKLASEPLRSAFLVYDLVDRDAIDPSCASIPAHLLPPGHQHVCPIDPVVQSVKPEPRLSLGLLV